MVGAAVGALGLLGFVNSFAAVARAAGPAFGPLAPTVPLGIDLGIAVFSALDIVLARLDMRPRWVRLIPWCLTAATIYLNVAGSPPGSAGSRTRCSPRCGSSPCRWPRTWSGSAPGWPPGPAMDRIRLVPLAAGPGRTALLWRRMVLWEIRSYPDALRRERDRLLALTGLQDAYGVARVAVARAAPGPRPVPARRADPRPRALPPRPRCLWRSRPRSPPSRRRVRPAPPGRAVPQDVDALMPLGWQITADLAARGEPLTRDTLAAGLRAAGHTAGNARVGALLAR